MLPKDLHGSFTGNGMGIVQQCNRAAEQQSVKKRQAANQKAIFVRLSMLLLYCSTALLSYYKR